MTAWGGWHGAAPRVGHSPYRGNPGIGTVDQAARLPGIKARLAPRAAAATAIGR